MFIFLVLAIVDVVNSDITEVRIRYFILEVYCLCVYCVLKVLNGSSKIRISDMFEIVSVHTVFQAQSILVQVSYA
jgi:hypothetical protein